VKRTKGFFGAAQACRLTPEPRGQPVADTPHELTPVIAEQYIFARIDGIDGNQATNGREEPLSLFMRPVLKLCGTGGGSGVLPWQALIPGAT
jgi:hypothetical protein